MRRRPELAPVTPAKAGIQTVSAKFAILNQVRIEVGGSLLPLWVCRGRFGCLGARASRRRSRACARRALTLAFSHKGLIGVGLRLWERGRPARNAALARGDTLILAFSHKGRRDPLTAICT